MVIKLTRDAILEANDLPTKEVDVPEWGGSLYVRTMTGTERDAFEASLWVKDGEVRRQDLTNFRARLVATTATDEKGDRLFSDKDVVRLGMKSSLALSRVFDAAQKLNGIGEKEEGEAIKN
jgi:hypothetical protein